MFSLLLKKALPFTLTFVVGAGLGWLFTPSDTGGRRMTLGAFELPEPTMQEVPFGRRHRECHMRRYTLVAETKPLVILFKPDARWPRGLEAGKEGVRPVRANVTFGADGRIGAVSPVGGCFAFERDGEAKPIWDAVERAALRIQFEPATVNSIPISVTKEVEIRFMAD